MRLLYERLSLDLGSAQIIQDDLISRWSGLYLQSCFSQIRSYTDSCQGFRGGLPIGVSPLKPLQSSDWSLPLLIYLVNKLYCGGAAQSLSYVQLLATPWTVACQTPLSMGFSRQEHWSGEPCPPPGDLPDPGIKPTSLVSPALTGGFFTSRATWEALKLYWGLQYFRNYFRATTLGKRKIRSLPSESFC